MPKQKADPLAHIESLMRSGTWKRVLTYPWRYTLLFIVRMLSHFGVLHKVIVTRKTIFSFSIRIALPGHADIFLFGAKTSPSDIHLTRYLIKRIKPDSTAIDIGASIGYYSLLISSLLGKTGHVLAIEPSRLAFQLLQANAAKMPHITLRQLSVGEKDKPGTIYTFPPRYAEYNTVNMDPFLTQSNWYNEKNVTPESVHVKSLDSILHDINIVPDIVKFDAENSDMAIVEGMHAMIKKVNPEIIMRYWPQGRDHTQQVEAIEKLQSFGYTVQGFTSDGSLIDLHHLDNYSYEYLILKH